jgi:anti-anti-sigma factor
MAESTLRITTEAVGNVTVVVLDGPVDSATHDIFRQTLDPLFLKPAPFVLLDCTNLTYINSKGLAVLAKYHRSAFANLGWLAVCAVNRKVVRTMDLLGLGRVLKFYATREEALADMPASAT